MIPAGTQPSRRQRYPLRHATIARQARCCTKDAGTVPATISIEVNYE